MSDQTVKIPLQDPFKLTTGELKSELVVRQPTVGDVIEIDEMEGSELRREVALAARVSGLELDDYFKVSLRDAKKIREVVDKALGKSDQEDGGE